MVFFTDFFLAESQIAITLITVSKLFDMQHHLVAVP